MGRDRDRDSRSDEPSRSRARSLHEAAWPDMFANLESAYAELTRTRFELERRAAEIETTRDLFQQVIESMSEALFLIDCSGRIIRTNPAAASLLGRDASDILDRPFREVLGDDTMPSTPWQLLGRAPSGKSLRHAVEVRKQDERDGSILNFSYALVRDSRGRITGVLAVARDVTEEKRSERALQRLNETLEQKVTERTNSLVRYQGRLQALTSELMRTEHRERRRLATELHDYLAQLLVVCKMKMFQIRDAAEPSPVLSLLDEAEEVLDRAIAYTRTLVAELSPAILYASGLPDAVTWLASQLRQQHGLHVDVRRERDFPRLPDDTATLIYEIIRELLFNVIKHARVEAATVVLSGTPDEIEVSVADEGVGFEPDMAEIESSAADKFGLFSIRERLESIDGRLKIESAPDRGARLTIGAPVRGPQPDVEPPQTARIAPPPEPSAPTANERKGVVHVLLADDHAMIREGLRTVIESDSNLTVVGEAADGEQALELARALQPDVVVMDINMPKMNGIEATHRIKRELPMVGVIGLSVHLDAEFARAMTQAGAAAYLSKDGPSLDLRRAILAVSRRERR